MAAQSNAQQTFEELVAAVKQAESRGKRYASDGKTLTTSPKGALGEMQVMPTTITDPGFGVTPARDKSPDEIARVGVDYLQAMTQKYGDTEKALIAYNWGPGSTDKWIASGADPKKLPDETRTYVQRVKGFLGKDVSRETNVAKKEREPMPASLPPMAEAPQAKTTTVAKLDMANMPASYKAAFALAALADAQDEEDDKAFNENKQTETETFFANYKPVNHLASLDLSVAPVNFADGGEVTERKDEPFFDAASRTFVDVMTGRRTPITEKDFTAREQLAMMDAVKKSQARGGKGRVDYQDYPDASTVGPGYVDIRNTLGGFQYKQNPDGSTVITDRYDFHGPRVAEYEKMGTGEKLVKSAKNALTEFVTKGFSPRDLAGELGRAYIGSKGPEVNIRIPVNRANGGDAEPTAEEIAAASTPAFIAQKSGIGRRSGNISKALKSGEGYVEFAKGLTNVPQNIVGAPMDISNMIANVYGGGVEKPFMGSEYLKEKSRAAGLGFTPSTDPTLAAFYGAGDLGSNLVNPAGATRAGVKAVGKTGEAAKMLAKDFQQYNQELAVPGASYAVRNKGTPVAMTGLPFLPNVDEAEKVVKMVTIGQRKEPLEVTDKSLNDWFSKTVTRYLRSDFATPQDQLVRAAEENKMLHLAPKEFSDSAEDQALKHFLGRRQSDLEYMRQAEGFGKSNMATTPYGQRIEDITDISAYPERLEDLTPNRVPASMRNLVETQPEARVTDFAPNIVENLKLEQLRDKMLDVRQSDGKYGAYGQPAVKIPSEFLLPDNTLAKLNVAAASNRMARYTNWQNETRQKMATTALRADPAFPRAELQEGKFLGVALPDIKKNPEAKQLVIDVGCDGGWCTRYTPNAEAYASGFSRLHVIVTGEGKQARPVAQFAIADSGPSYDTKRFSITEVKEKGNTKDFANNPALPAIQEYIQYLDKTYGGLDYVDDLKGLRMTQLPEYPMQLLDLFNPTVQQRRMLENKYGSEENGFRAVRDKAVDLNNGSRFMTGNEDAVANSLEQAMQLLVGPKETLARRIQMNLFGLPKEKATGGMIERQPNDNRRYL